MYVSAMPFTKIGTGVKGYLETLVGSGNKILFLTKFVQVNIFELTIFVCLFVGPTFDRKKA